MMRSDNRNNEDLRPISITLGNSVHAEGSAMVNWGNTQVWCSATIENSVPRFLRHKNHGWITAEYNMLPRATYSRTDRKSTISAGRTLEISRLIGRTLRAITHLEKLGERQIRIDCDVLNADGGTRIASLIGGHLALHCAIHWLHTHGMIASSPLVKFLTAVSAGVWRGEVVFDLPYSEDTESQVDGTIVADTNSNYLELQFTAEKEPLGESHLSTLLQKAPDVLAQVTRIQRRALSDAGIITASHPQSV